MPQRTEKQRTVNSLVAFFLNAYYGILIRNTAKLCQERREIIHLEQRGRQGKALKVYFSLVERFCCQLGRNLVDVIMFSRGFKRKSKVSKALECTVPAGFLPISVRIHS